MLLQTNCPALPPVHIHTPGFSFGINDVYALGVVAASAAVIVFINKLVPVIMEVHNRRYIREDELYYRKLHKEQLEWERYSKSEDERERKAGQSPDTTA